MTQRDQTRCACGGRLIVTPTQSPYEFTYACATCTDRGVMSWDHGAPPPTFQATGSQGELFE